MQHPDPPRLKLIIERFRVFLRVLEAAIPIEGDPERFERPFGVDWHTAEFHLCKAASDLCDVVDGATAQGGRDSIGSATGWDPQINLGLQCLESQLHTLLDAWKAHEWEDRLVRGGREASHPVTIKAEELAGLRRTLETIEEGQEHLGIAPEAVEQRSEAKAKRGKGDRLKRLAITRIGAIARSPRRSGPTPATSAAS